MSHNTFRLICCAAALTISKVTFAETLYRATLLGTLGGNYSEAFSINNNGVVTGWSEVGRFIARSFIYDGTMHDLGTIGRNNFASDINSVGQVTGRLDNASGLGHAFLWNANLPIGDTGTMYDIGSGFLFSAGAGINAYGQVTGNTQPADGSGGLRAFIWQPTSRNGNSGTMYELPTLGGRDSSGLDINARGQVTGDSSITGNTTSRAYIWTPSTPNGITGKMVPIDTLGGTGSRGVAINSRGWVTGFAGTSTGQHAFLYDGKEMHDLGSLVPGLSSEGKDLNSSGRVVGTSFINGPAIAHAFVYRGSEMTDLNLLIDRNPGWEFVLANGINDRGQIVGVANTSSGQRAFRLTIIPENFKQYDRRNTWWDDTTLRSPSGKKMFETGCFVTAAAIVLSGLDHRTDPGHLNALLAPNDPNTGDLNFDRFPRRELYGQPDKVIGPSVRFRTIPVSGGGRASIVQQLKRIIDRQGPIILRVPSANEEGKGIVDYKDPKRPHAHAIVAYDVRQDGQLLIRDPGWPHPGESLTAHDQLTLDEYINFVNSQMTDPQYRIKNSDGSGNGLDYSWLTGSAMTYPDIIADSVKHIGNGKVHSPVELVLTDSLGRRLGFDPILGEFYNEIPESYYGREAFVAPTEGESEIGDDFAPLAFEVGDLIPGKYKFSIFGVGEGPWSIDLGFSNADRQFLQTNLLSGTATAGSYQELLIDGSAFGIVPEPNTFVLAIAWISGVLASGRKRSFGEESTAYGGEQRGHSTFQNN
jgi:probable HAF family extracellular repeat protein